MYSSRRSEVQNRSFSLKSTITTVAKDVLHQSDNEELPKNPFDYSLEDLEVIEKERRSLLTRVKRFSLMNISTSFYGTVLPDLLRSMFFWFNLGLYIAIRVVLKTEKLAIGLELPQINTTLVSIVGGFMSFFLVFFVSQAYTRFCLQYDNSMRIEGRMLNLSFFAKNNLEPAEAWRFVRYINAIHVAGYTGLSHIYTEVNIFDTMNSKHKLLTDVETKRVKEIGLNAGGTAYREILGWCYEILYSQFRKHREQFDVISFQTMINELMTLRGCMGSLFDYDDQPIPFIYIHLVFIMSLFYCPLISYTVAVYMPAKTVYIFPDILGCFLVFLNMVYVIGLREIGHAMNTPYEDSLQDLSVLHYLNFSIGATRKILAGSSMPSPGIEIEEELESTRPELNLAFQDHSVSAGGPRLNNFHQSKVLLHQHHRPYAMNTHLLSPLASTKSASDAIAASQYGVYAPYLAGTVHHSYPSFHPHQMTTGSGNSIQHSTVNGNNHPVSGGKGHVASSSFTSTHAHQHPHQHHHPDNDKNHTTSTLPLYPVSHPKHTGSGSGTGGVTHSHSFTEGLSTQQYTHNTHQNSTNTMNNNNNNNNNTNNTYLDDDNNVLLKTGDFHSVSQGHHPNLDHHLHMHDTALLTLQEESRRSMQQYAQQALFPGGMAESSTRHPHAHIQTSPSTVSLTSLIGENLLPSDKSDPICHANINPSAASFLASTSTGKQKSHRKLNAETAGEDETPKASLSSLLTAVDVVDAKEVDATRETHSMHRDTKQVDASRHTSQNSKRDTLNSVSENTETPTLVPDSAVSKQRDTVKDTTTTVASPKAETSSATTSATTSAPPPPPPPLSSSSSKASPPFIETRKRRNTRILHSEDSLSLVPEDTASDHET